MTWKEIMHYCNHGNEPAPRRVEKSEEEWAKELDPETFRITRLKGTERAFSGEHCSSYEEGKYACSCCDEPLFDSSIKFDSKSGWPSFTVPLKPEVIKYEKDNSFGMVRVEVMCNVCNAHLGHVFPDGPAPSGLRYCINSLSLKMMSKA